MKNFTNEQQKAFIPMIKYDAWINTALLSSLLLSAFLKQAPLPMLWVFLLLLTWAIHMAQHFKAFTNIKLTSLLLETMQVTTMLIAGISLLMLFIK